VKKKLFSKILITGGAGFVGSNLAIFLKKDFPKTEVICLDNLKRRGSELSISRLKENNILFFHGDIRNKEDLQGIKNVDVLIECSAEPSVLAGYDGSPEYLINTNLMGTLNCLELARKNKSMFIFLSTSRVYPTKTLNSLDLEESDSRFEIKHQQPFQGISDKGVSENFPLEGSRSLYGATKLASEIIINEYASAFNLKTVINRCGVITGPWQMGKIDQGVVVLWAAKHFFKGKLSYIGFGGLGKQVRDILHVKDLYDLIKLQLTNINKFSGETYNVGGGRNVSISLKELTEICQKHTKNKLNISKVLENRNQDVPVYITDISKINKLCGWKPKIKPEEILKEVFLWLKKNEKQLKPILK